MNIWLIGIGVIIGLLLLIEGGLRIFLGLGNPPLYLSDPEIGYLLAPNQQLRRMGNRIEINEYSMRGSTLTEKRVFHHARLFLIGDSVANGAWWTDQQETISALMKGQLESKINQEVEVLNASANSWGPRNQVAYLHRFGCFDTQGILLLINTDDLFATAPTSVPVGRDRNYPDRKPILALVEAYQRYFLSPQEIPEMKIVKQERGDRVGFNLQAIEEMQTISHNGRANFYLALTPLLREIGKPGSREYEQKARKRLEEFTQIHQIPYLDFLPLMQKTDQPQQYYRDHIHLNGLGNQFVSQVLSDFVLSSLTQNQKD